MEQEKIFTTENATYKMTPANAFKSWNAIKRALKILDKLVIPESNTSQADNADDTDKQGKQYDKLGVSMITAILSNLGSPEMNELEQIVLSQTVVTSAEKPYRLSDQFDQHFNKYREDLIPVLVEGVKYQFADFFSGGLKCLTSTAKTVEGLMTEHNQA